MSCDSFLYLSLTDVDNFDLAIDTPDKNAISMQAERSTGKRVLRIDGLDLLFRSWFPNFDKPVIGNGGEDVLCFFGGSYIMDYAFVTAIFSNWLLLLSGRKVTSMSQFTALLSAEAVRSLSEKVQLRQVTAFEWPLRTAILSKLS